MGGNGFEFTIERSEFLTALYLAQGIVERRTTIPILGNVLIESDEDSVRVVATDQETITVQRRSAAEIAQGGRLTTPARTLYEMMRQLPDGPVRLRVLENNWIDVSAERSRFRLVGVDPAEFPVPSEPPKIDQAIRLTGSVLADLIEHSLFAVSLDEGRANLNGIYLETPEPGRLRAVATDGHRLAVVTRSVEGARLEQGVILPRKAVLELKKVLESGGADPVDLFVDQRVAHVEQGAVRMSMRLVEGSFPDYAQVVPARSTRVASADSASLLAALRRVSVVSSERTRGVKLQLEGQVLTLSSINPDVGEAADEVEIEYEGPPVAVGFNVKYVIDVLTILPSGSRVEIGLNDDVSPGLFSEPGDTDFRYVVMPMRL